MGPGQPLKNPPRARWQLTLAVPALAIAIAMTTSGCGSMTLVDETPMNITGPLGSGESVVILRKNQRAASRTERDFVDCVAQSLHSNDYGIRVIPEQRFVDALYPHFEISSAPTEVEALEVLQQHPAAAEKLSELGARYIVWMHGNTETIDSGGSLSCAIGPGGGGCLGLASWTDRGAYKADFWDIKALTDGGTIDLKSSGTSYVTGLVVPIPLLARVKSNACDSMAALIAESLG